MKTPKKAIIVASLLAVTAGWSNNPVDVKEDRNLLGFEKETVSERPRSILKLRSSVFGQMREDERESHGPGVFANLGIFLPSPAYMDPYYLPEFGLYNVGYIAEVGNYFRFFNTDKFGVGLRATWIQLGYTTHSDTSFVHGNAWGSPLRLGPQASYAINDVMGLDLYYQIGAHYSMVWYGSENASFLGASHELGFAYRFMFITAGAAYKFGAFKHIDNSDPQLPLDEYFKYSTNMLRVFVGIQL